MLGDGDWNPGCLAPNERTRGRVNPNRTRKAGRGLHRGAADTQSLDCTNEATFKRGLCNNKIVPPAWFGGARKPLPPPPKEPQRCHFLTRQIDTSREFLRLLGGFSQNVIPQYIVRYSKGEPLAVLRPLRHGKSKLNCTIADGLFFLMIFFPSSLEMQTVVSKSSLNPRQDNNLERQR
ncbi:hypothetical protein VTK26DRAFT_3595 [Humicola hyalothermophila]